METLESKRKKIREIDRRLIDLLAKRVGLAKQIAAEKVARGLPLQNLDVETEVVRNAARQAGQIGLCVDFAEAIIRSVITESKIEQETIYYAKYAGEPQTVLIIGGLGAMGQWLARFFTRQGHRVILYDIRKDGQDYATVASLAEGLRNADTAVISVSLDQVAMVIDKLCDIEFRGLLFDIASIKGQLIPHIRKAVKSGLRVTSVHPMFGPATRALSDKAICFCDCGDEQATRRAKAFFKDTAAHIVDVGLDKHDEAISYVLGLSHLINIVFMHILEGSPFSYNQLRSIASTTFLSQMETASSVIREKPELYYQIQKYNPNQKKLYAGLQSAIDSVIDSVVAGDGSAFIADMDRSRQWLEERQDSREELS